MKSYQNQYFSILGDSISTLLGYNPPECEVFYNLGNMCLADITSPENTWWGQVIQSLGGTLLVNHSWSGSLVCRHPLCEIQSYGCSDNRTRALDDGEHFPDVIMILMGLNDWGHGMPVTSHDPNDLAAFSAAYDTMLKKLKTNYPSAEIWCLTLPVSQTCRETSARYPDHKKIENYCQAIITCGKNNGCHVINISTPETTYETMDDYHPNANGMKTIASAVLKEIQS